MKRIKRYLLLIACAATLAASSFNYALAITVAPPPIEQSSTKTTPDILIDSFGEVKETDNNGVNQYLYFVGLYNQSGKPVNVTNLSFSFTTSAGEAGCTGDTYKLNPISTSGWIRNKGYYALGQPGVFDDNAINTGRLTTSNLSNCNWQQLTKLKVFASSNNQPIQIIDLAEPDAYNGPVWWHYQHDDSINTTRHLENNFHHDYRETTSDPTVYTNSLYQPPSDASGLRIVEVLPRAHSCPSGQDALICHDYIKLYNPNSAPLNYYSVAYNSLTSNQISRANLGLAISHGKYLFVDMDDDRNMISLANDGGYIQLEDAGGVEHFGQTVQYPSAGSETKLGTAWAIGDNGKWQWTSTPQPSGPNIITPLSESEDSNEGSSSLEPCAPDQYRNPLTNRCKLKVTAHTLVPCGSDQYRNPATNRCKSLLASTSSLKPCATNQYRNPATNRCKLKSSSSSQYKPCQAGWTRNPDTHRCRKGSSVKGASINTIKDVKTPTKRSNTEWLIASLAVIAALGYAAYEWRHEVLRQLSVVKKKMKR